MKCAVVKSIGVAKISTPADLFILKIKSNMQWHIT
jgi:hypothetical protein